MTVTERHMPFVVANDALDQTQRLRDLLAENGYLFFRSLGPKDRILALRRQMLEICAQAGWVDPKADLMDAIWSGAGPFAENDPPYMEVYRRIVHLALFKALPNLTGNRLRLSCDNRYQLQGDQTGPAAHRTHHDL